MDTLNRSLTFAWFDKRIMRPWLFIAKLTIEIFLNVFVNDLLSSKLLEFTLHGDDIIARQNHFDLECPFPHIDFLPLMQNFLFFSYSLKNIEVFRFGEGDQCSILCFDPLEFQVLDGLRCLLSESIIIEPFVVWLVHESLLSVKNGYSFIYDGWVLSWGVRNPSKYWQFESC